MCVSASSVERVAKSLLAAIFVASLWPIAPTEKAYAEEEGNELGDTAASDDVVSGDVDVAVEDRRDIAVPPFEAAFFVEHGDVAPLTSASDFPLVDWTTSGTCRWMIDAGGCLTIEPLPGAVSGSISSFDWKPYKDKITSVVAGKGVCVATSARAMFKDYPRLSSADLSGLDVSFAGSMSEMFRDCPRLASVKLTGLDTSHITDMSYMFWGCSRLVDVDLSGLETSQVRNMRGMFIGCLQLASANLSGLDTSRVTDMCSMFYGCSYL